MLTVHIVQKESPNRSVPKAKVPHLCTISPPSDPIQPQSNSVNPGFAQFHTIPHMHPHKIHTKRPTPDASTMSPIHTRATCIIAPVQVLSAGGGVCEDRWALAARQMRTHGASTPRKLDVTLRRIIGGMPIAGVASTTSQHFSTCSALG